jgi:hypothetical protein
MKQFTYEIPDLSELENPPMRYLLLEHAKRYDRGELQDVAKSPISTFISHGDWAIKSYSAMQENRISMKLSDEDLDGQLRHIMHFVFGFHEIHNFQSCMRATCEAFHALEMIVQAPVFAELSSTDRRLVKFRMDSLKDIVSNISNYVDFYGDRNRGAADSNYILVNETDLRVTAEGIELRFQDLAFTLEQLYEIAQVLIPGTISH